MLSLEALSRAVSALSTDTPEEIADIYWLAYTTLIRGKTPPMQRRFMKLLADDACLQAATELFHNAHAGTGLSFQMMSAREPLPSVVWLMDKHYRQIGGPYSATCEANGVLRAAIEGAIYLQAKREQCHAAG